MTHTDHRSAGHARLLALAFLLLLLPACSVHTHRMGGGATGSAPPESMRQYYIFFGLLQLNEVNEQRFVGDLSSYDVRTEYGWTDIFLTPLLLPLTVTTRTVTIYR